jgi:hypothetical protein
VEAVARSGDRPCACGCGKSARAGEYHSDCRAECKCGCGGRARYAYMPGHGPKAVECSRCGKSVAPKAGDGMCSQCRRHVNGGGPVVQDTKLIETRRKQAASPKGKKWCSGCERYRAESFFGQYTEKGVRKRYSRCKPCQKAQGRASVLARKYNITSEQYNLVKEAQGGKCAICQRATGATKALAVDHDHSCCGHGGSCGKCVRGLLCSTCNKLLGFARDDPAMFYRAINYLKEPPAKRVLHLTLNGET